VNPALFGTLCAFGWGTADFAARFTGRALGYANALLGMLIVGSCGLSAWVWLSDAPLVWEWSHAWLLGVTGVGVMVATLLLYAGLARGPVTIVAPIVASYPALVVAFAVAWGSRPTLLQWGAMLLVLVGVIIVARCAGRFECAGHVDRAALRTTVLIALCSSIGFAVLIIAGQHAAPVYGELQVVWISRLVSLVSLFVYFWVRRQPIQLSRRWWPVLVAQGLLDAGGYLALFAGSHGAYPELAAVTASAFGAVTVVLARMFLREAMSTLQWFGILLLFAGVAVLSI